MNQPTEPIRKSSLPTTPPPEWEFFTFFPYPEEDGGDMVRGQRQRGVQIRRLVTYGDWEPVRPDRWADEPELAVSSAGQAPATNHTDLREQIAETLATAEGWTWAHGLQFKDIDTPSAEAYRKLADAVLAVLPAPTDRAATLREEADRIDATRADFPIAVQNGITWATAEMRRHAAELRRLADETPDTQTTEQA